MPESKCIYFLLLRQMSEIIFWKNLLKHLSWLTSFVDSTSHVLSTFQFVFYLDNPLIIFVYHVLKLLCFMAGANIVPFNHRMVIK
jgi:hypothetical protein